MFFNYLYKNWFNIILSFLISLFITFVALPFVWDKNIPLIDSSIQGLLKELLKTESITYLLGISSVIIVFLLLKTKELNYFFQRYKNTYRLKNPTWILADSFFLTTTITIILFIFYQTYLLRSFHISAPAKYILAGLFIICLIWLSLTYYLSLQKKKLVVKPESEFPISDEPITTKSDDALGRGTFVESLYSQIINLPTSDSFVLGLYGNWGEGKTSILNMLCEKLQINNDFIIVHFDPWYFTTKEAIFTQFYIQIVNTISKLFVFDDLKRLVIKYRHLISIGLSHLGIKVDTLSDSETVEETKYKLESYLEKTERTLVFIIDDIDRLDKEDILLIFKLVKLNTNLKNTIFLLSLDDGIVYKKIEELTGERPNEYIQKIVQVPLRVPQIDEFTMDKILLYSDHKVPEIELPEINISKNILKSFSTHGYIQTIDKNKFTIADKGTSLTVRPPKGLSLSEYLGKKEIKRGDRVSVEGNYHRGQLMVTSYKRIQKFRLSAIDKVIYSLYKNKLISLEQIQEFDKEFPSFYKENLRPYFRNIRDIKRYINSLMATITPTAGDINLFDFALLEIIKIHHPLIYEDIYNNWWFYLSSRKYGDFAFSPYFMRDDTSKRVEDTYNHIKSKTDIIKDEEKRSAIKKIISKLFPYTQGRTETSSEDVRDKKIGTESFFQYFMLQPSSSDIPKSAVEKIIEELNHDQTTIENIRKILLQFKDKELLLNFLEDLLFTYRIKINSKLAEKLIEFITSNIEFFSAEENGDYFRSERDRARSLVMWLINDKYEKKDIQKKVIDLIKKVPNITLAIEIVLFCKKDRGDLFNLYESINIDEIRKAMSDRLQKYYIEGKRDIFKDDKERYGFILWQWGTNWGQTNGVNNKLVNDYVISLIKSSSKRLPKFIKMIKGNSPLDDYFDLKGLSQVYNLKEIYDILIKNRQSKELDSESKKLINTFIQQYEKSLNTNTT